MHSNTKIKIKQRIKFRIFILLFLLIPFHLNKQFNREFKTNISLSPPKIENRTKVESEEKIGIVRTSVSPIKQMKEEIEVDSPSIIALQSPPIQFIFPAIQPDTFLITQEMKKLVKHLRPSYKAKRLHISPVEYRMNIKDLLIPASMITIGTIASQTDKYRDFIPGIRKNAKERLTPFDDIAQLLTSPSLFLFDIFAKEEHHPIDQFFLMALSYGITTLPVRTIKNNYFSERPYGGNHSFPSGHTATAFVGAHMIFKEFKNTNNWIAYSGYAMASVVAGARVVNHKHWACDVIAGAGIAILSTELAYCIYFPVRNLLTNEINKLVDKHILLVPIIHPQILGAQLSVRL
jgi:Membrane-associated phospholipid phosphatase